MDTSSHDGVTITFKDKTTLCPDCNNPAKILDGTFRIDNGNKITLLSGPDSTVRALKKIHSRMERLKPNPPFLTYYEMLSKLSDFSVMFYAAMVANAKFLKYLLTRAKTDENKYSIRIDESFTKGLVYNPIELTEHMDKRAEELEMTYEDYCHRLIQALVISAQNTYITNAYEIIKNYSEHNKEKKILLKLQKFPWFQMIHMLRRNASHFNNLGKKLGGWNTDYPDIIEWNGFSIAKDQIGHELKYSDHYLATLIHHCRSHLESNPDLYK